MPHPKLETGNSKVEVMAPRLVIAGLAGDGGKTIASLSVLLALRQHGIPVLPFKKGPDYIDPAWLGWAAGRTARNLDTYLMGPDEVSAAFSRHALSAGINLIEGNRGLFDGFDTAGTHSTAELAKLLRAPVILAVNAVKVTRTVAAMVLGSQKFDPELNIAGVVVNRVNGKRHERILRSCIEESCGIPVLGALPKIEGGDLLPERHMGLITPEEHGPTPALEMRLREHMVPALDLERLIDIAQSAPMLQKAGECRRQIPDGHGLKIGFLKDSAFTFYYPENLEALESSGAELVPVSALAAGQVPNELDALYIGGGFPETHGERLAKNTCFLNSLRAAAQDGLPIYAECGGLMLLSRAIAWRGTKYAMAGVLPFEVEVCPTPQGHGYAELLVDTANPFFPTGTRLRGHEFHYSRLVVDGDAPVMASAVLRGSGSWQRRDSAIMNNVWAGYTHLHALASPEWALAVVNAAIRHKCELSTISNQPGKEPLG